MSPALKFVEGRVIVEVDLEAKNWHTFENGTRIRRERQFDNLNRRETEPVNAIVISAENIPSGVEILIHPNAPTENNRITNYRQLSGTEISSDIKYYSVPEDQCFAWFDEKENNWKPLPPYETALRVFKPYTGVLSGIEPEKLKDTLFVTSGELKGMVVLTVKAADYQIVFQDKNGKEGNLIRFRPNGDPKTKREPEAIAVLNEETNLVNKGKLIIGITKGDAKPLSTKKGKRQIPKDFQLEYKTITVL